jgi:hypothetical protein
MVADRKLQVNLPARLQELNLVSIAPTNASEFRHPLSLLRLAQFVRDATKVCVCVCMCVRAWRHACGGACF